MQITIKQLYVFVTVVLAFMIVADYEKRSGFKELESAKGLYEKADYAAAFQVFRRLAKKGNAEAQYYLADMLVGGDGVPQNYAGAVEWYVKAADQGNVNAQFNLGVIYISGLGVPKNLVQAALWFRKASEEEDAEAQLNLGIMYFKGEGVPQDNIQSYMWLTLAGKSGNQRAELVRQLVATRMTQEQRAEGEKLSTAWKPKNKMACRPKNKAVRGLR